MAKAFWICSVSRGTLFPGTARIRGLRLRVLLLAGPSQGAGGPQGAFSQGRLRQCALPFPSGRLHRRFRQRRIYSGIGVFLSWNHENRNVSGFPDAGIDFGEWLRLRTSQDHRFPVAGNDNTTTLKLGTPSRKVPAIGNIELVVVNEDGG